MMVHKKNDRRIFDKNLSTEKNKSKIVKPGGKID